LGLGENYQSLGFYLFTDALYHNKLFIQLRPIVRVKFPWLSLMGSYAYPLSSGKIQISGQDIGAAKFWSLDADLVPISFLRLYGNMMIVEQKYKSYRVGAEIRPLKWISISADWNRTDLGFYSYWNSYKDFHIGLNILFGAQQDSLKPTYKKTIPVAYPILVNKITTPEKTRDVVEFMYERIYPVVSPEDSWLPTWFEIYNPKVEVGSCRCNKIAENRWVGEQELEYCYYKYSIDVNDYALSTGPIRKSIAKRLFARIKGDANWIELTFVTEDEYGEHAFFILNKGKIYLPT